MAAGIEAAAGVAPVEYADAREPGQRERNKLDKLRRIKEAARHLFISKGFDDTTTREIAARAGVGLGTVFVYAANKRDLLFLIANDGLEEAADKASAAVSPSASLLENLLGVFRHHYDYFARQPALSRLMLREMIFYESGAQARPFQKTREALIALVGDIIRLAIEQDSVVSIEPPQFVGWTIFCIYQVELRRWLACDELDLTEGLDRLRRALALLITGLNPDKRALALRPAAAEAREPQPAKPAGKAKTQRR
jgi:AcrR family transcriptional regulator